MITESGTDSQTGYVLSEESYTVLAQRIDQLEADNKRLARHNELLRAVTLSLWESYNMISDYIGELPNGTMRGVVSGCFKGCANKMQSAIDGGALETEDAA